MINAKTKVVIVYLLSLICTTSVFGFRDVLDLPAAQRSLPTKTMFNGVCIAGKRIIAVGRRGIIVYSDDQGEKWNQASVPVSADLNSVYFPSPQKGWAVGHSGIVLHSADNGATWVKQLDGNAAAQILASYYAQNPCNPDPGLNSENSESFMKEINAQVKEGQDKTFLDVWFENETTGFIVGAFNQIFRTGDGGKSWEPWFCRTENPAFFHLYSIRLIGRNLFIAGEQGLVLKLVPGTGMFSRVKTPYIGSYFDIIGNSSGVIAFGLRGNAFRSVDGGLSWEKIETGVPSGLTGGTVTDDGRIVVLVSQGGDVLESRDGGASFKVIETDKSFPATGVAALDKDTVVITGLQGVKIKKLK